MRDRPGDHIVTAATHGAFSLEVAHGRASVDQRASASSKGRDVLSGGCPCVDSRGGTRALYRLKKERMAAGQGRISY